MSTRQRFLAAVGLFLSWIALLTGLVVLDAQTPPRPVTDMRVSRAMP